jgi:hypothetical protein
MKFNLFKKFTLNWWQAGVFKIAVASVGVVIGATWPEIFAPLRLPLLLVYVLCGAFIAFVWWKQ